MDSLSLILGWPTPLLPLKVAKIQSLICYHYSLKKREGKLSVELPHGQFFFERMEKRKDALNFPTTETNLERLKDFFKEYICLDTKYVVIQL